MTAPVGSAARDDERDRGTPVRSTWFPVLVFLGIAAVLYPVVQLSHDHLSSENPPSPTDLSETSTLGGWMQFDSGWYVYLAEHGYDQHQVDEFKAGRQSAVAYFPSYPLVVRQVARLTPDTAEAALLTTFLCGLAFAVLFWRWCRARLSPRARRLALLLLLLYPYSWFLFGSGYGDALFLVATIGAFLLLEADHPVLAGLVGIVALAGRPTGAAVLIGLVAVLLERRGAIAREDGRWRFDRSRLRGRDAGVLVALSGLVAWCAYCAARFGDPLAFATVQKAPGWDQRPGPHTWFKISFFGHLLHDSPSYSLRLVAEGALSLLFVLLVVLVWKRLGWGYAVYSFAMVAIPLVGTSDFQGMGRYLIGCFPVFAAAGDWLSEERRTRVAVAVLAFSAASLLALSSLFGRGYYLT